MKKIISGLEDEEVLGRIYDAHLLKRLWIYIKPHWKIALLSSLIFPALSGLQLVRPYLLKIGIDLYIIPGDLSGLNKLGIIYIVILFFEFFLNYFNLYVMQLLGQRAMFDLRRDVFSHLEKLPMSFYERNPVGRLVTRGTNDIEVINEMFASGIIAIVSDILKLVGIVVLLFILDVKLTLAAFSLVPVLIIAVILFRIRAREAYRKIRLWIAAINAYLAENVTGMSVVQLFGREKVNREEFSKINNEHRQFNFMSIKYDSLLFALVEAITTSTTAIIVWYAGGRLISETLTFGTLFAFIRYLEMFFIPIRDMSAKYTIMQQAMAGAERVFGLLDTKSAIDEPENPREIKEPRGEVEFRDVWFGYNSNEPVLKGISFKVKPGEKVAIVGPTGAGKTTAIKLLERFYDVNEGQILIDGVDIRDLRSKDLRRMLGLVLQDVFLFTGSISSNITLGEDIDESEVLAAAKAVRAHKFISMLPDGYDEELTERGSNLSGGQKQLLSFARALAYNPAVLVLDEATSSVDSETEHLIQEATQELMKDRTSIIVAHRLSTIENADRILVFNHGKIIERGSHKELLQNGGLYSKLHKLQYVLAPKTST